MNKTSLTTTAAALLVGLVVFFPGWLEVSRAREHARNFALMGRENQLEVKVLLSEKYPENPFSWFGGKPTFVVARQARDENFLILFSSYTDDDKTTNKALVSANCAGHTLRVVTQARYETYLRESGYSILGDKLPPWSTAGYDSMLAVLLAQESIKSGTNLLFTAACHWDNYKSAA